MEQWTMALTVPLEGTRWGVAFVVTYSDLLPGALGGEPQAAHDPAQQEQLAAKEQTGGRGRVRGQTPPSSTSFCLNYMSLPWALPPFPHFQRGHLTGVL